MSKQFLLAANQPEFLPGRIVELNKQGKSASYIAKECGVSKTTILRKLKAFKATGSMVRKKGSGRPRKTNERSDRLIIHEVNRDPFITGDQIKARNPVLNVSSRTIRRRIVETGIFKSYWAAKKPFLSAQQIKRRLEWCRYHVTWTEDQWRSVLFSDESPFVLRFNGRRRVWRRENERYLFKNTIGTVKHDIKINVWGCFAYHGVGNIHHIEGIMDAGKYIRILDNDMRRSSAKLFPRSRWIFQQDNDPKHTAKATKEYLELYGIDVLDWPANSPDLNPIENLWSYLDRMARGRTPNNALALFQVIKNAWEMIPVAYLNSLVSSMKQRCQAVIDAGGKHTKY